MFNKSIQGKPCIKAYYHDTDRYMLSKESMSEILMTLKPLNV